MLQLFQQKMSTISINSLKRNLIAVCQMTSQHDLQENLKICTEMIERAKHRDAKVLHLTYF